MGLAEAFAATSVNLIGLLGALYFVREKYAVMLLYLVIVMGIQGMVMTRDMFNLFVFLEIVSIATYGLLSLGSTTAALSASFKFLMATIVASTLFLLGTMLLYAVTGMLNIDDLIANRATIEGPVGFAALMLLLACLLLELKPFPANGWGLDVYETAPSSVASLIATGVSAGVFFALYNLFPLFENHAEVIAILGAATFVVSNLIGLAQTKAQRLLGYSSVGQMGLVSMASGALASIRCRSGDPIGCRRTVRQSSSRQGRVVLACGTCRQGEHRRLVGAHRQARDIRLCPPALRDRRAAAVSRVLGKVAVDLRACVRRRLCVDRAGAAGVAARGCLSLPLVRTEPAPPHRQQRIRA